MISVLLAFGGVFFIGLAILAILIMAAQIHNERVGWAVTTLIVTVALIALFTNVPTLLKGTPPIHYLYAALAYLGIAGVWATIKWRCFFLPKLFDRYNTLREAFLKRKGLKEMPTDQSVIDEFKNQREVSYLDINNTRMVRYNKARITTWIVFWWASMIDTFIGDFLVNVFDYVYRSISGMLQRMSDSMASKYSELS